MNRASLRSHVVFSVHVVVAEHREDGSERTSMTDASAGSAFERSGADFDKSISALGNVRMARMDVIQGRTRHVHYRDSKLTFLLREALGGNDRTSLVVTVALDKEYST
ncbi:hypothetical protein PsorP6_011520 [Peronosclerospora sorghi]|uniref:Uncharacterized protein n=1 Tax=Peronosclerospora sorghi TaxID=230839 RepID=A0ACC0WI10_9STRA|nr:hypothetical protein PsorP6_011520 [Peronosclerospora sorghi]